MQHLIKIKLASNIKDYFLPKNLNTILTFMKKDKKNISNKINLILIKRVGSTIINNEYNSLKIKNFLKKELSN